MLTRPANKRHCSWDSKEDNVTGDKQDNEDDAEIGKSADLCDKKRSVFVYVAYDYYMNVNTKININNQINMVIIQSEGIF